MILSQTWDRGGVLEVLERREVFAFVGLSYPQAAPFCSCLELREPRESGNSFP